jgi:hypothetical protein
LLVAISRSSYFFSFIPRTALSRTTFWYVSTLFVKYVVEVLAVGPWQMC